MKKICFLIFSVFFLTGCSAEYNLVYENGILSESLSVTSNKTDVIDGQSFDSLINNYYNNINLLVDYTIQPGDANEEEILSRFDFYNKRILEENGKYGINLFYSYKERNDFEKSYIVYNLYDNANISDNYIQVHSIKDIFSSYPYLDGINITFKSDKKVECINADKVEDNVCYWYVNKYNYLNNKSIKVNFINNEETNILTANNGWNIIYIILGIVGISLLIAFIVIYEKVKKSNK